MAKGSPLWITIISSVTSFIMTSLTVFFLGWNIHDKILSDVDEKIQKAVSSRLEKEPATFQITEQSKAIKDLSKEFKDASEKLVAIEIKLDAIKLLLEPKKISKNGGYD